MMEYDGDLKVPEHHLVPPPGHFDTVEIGFGAQKKCQSSLKLKSSACH